MTAADESSDGLNRPIDAFHRHEAMDRASLLLDMFNQYVAEHPAVLSDPALATEAEAISERLYLFYQRLGAAALDAK